MTPQGYHDVFRRQSRADLEEPSAVVGPHEHDAGDISGAFTQVRVVGDIFSTNWDGAIPADLSAGPDAAATLGFYLDSSAGAIQSMALYAEGGQIGNLTITGQLTESTVPATMTGLAVDSTGLHLVNGVQRAWIKLTWLQPTLNTNGSAMWDASGYRIRYQRSAVSEDWLYLSRIPYADTSIILYGLDLSTGYKMGIQCVDIWGNEGAWSADVTQTTATSPGPSQPTTPTGVGDSSAGILVSHDLDKAAGGDLEEDTVSLVVFISTTTPVVQDATTRSGHIHLTREMLLSGEAVSQKFTARGHGASRTRLVRGTTYYLSVLPVNAEGTAGTVSAASAAVVAGDTDGPQPPTVLAVADGGVEGGVGRLAVSWTASTSPDVTHVLVRHKRSTAAVYSPALKVDVDTTAIVLDGLKADKAYDVVARAIDVHGNKSAWAGPEQATPGSAHAAPAAPTLRGVGSNALVVFHDLTKAAGGQIDSDTTHLLVYVDTANPPLLRAGRIRVTEALLVEAAAGDEVHRRFAHTGTAGDKTDLVRGTTYYVAVRTVNWAGVVSAKSAAASVLAGDYTAPAAPTDLAAASGGVEGNVGKIDVTWTASTSTDVGHYMVQWRRTGATPWAGRQKCDDDDTAATLDHLKTGRSYDIRMRAIDVHGNRSAWTGTVTATAGVTPAAASAPSALGIGSAGVKVRHDLTKAAGGLLDSDTSHINIYIGTATAPTVLAGRVRVTEAILAEGDRVQKLFNHYVSGTTDTAFVRGTTYYIRVKAVNQAGAAAAAFSDEITVTAGEFTAPAVPAGLTVADDGVKNGVGAVRVYWSACAAADRDHYMLRWKKTADSRYSQPTKVDKDDEAGGVCDVEIDGLLPNVGYDFVVRCVDVHGNKSAWSAVVACTPGGDVTAPTQLPAPTVTARRGGVRVTFDLSSGSWGQSNYDCRNIRVYLSAVSAEVTTYDATKLVGRIHTDYRALHGMETVSLDVDLPAGAGGTTYYAAGRGVDWAGNLNTAAALAGNTAAAQFATADYGAVSVTGPIWGGGIIGKTVDTVLAGSAGDGALWGSENFVAGTSGWQIDGLGNAEFNNVTIRGTVYATAGELGDLDVTGTLSLTGVGTIETASGYSVGGAVPAVVISAVEKDSITFYSGSASEATAGVIQALVTPALYIGGPRVGIPGPAYISLLSDSIVLGMAGVGQVAVNNGSIYPITDNDIDLGTSTLSFKNIYAYNLYDEAGNLVLDLSAGVPAGTHALDAGQSDVTITAVADHEVLAYDSGSATWINMTAAEAGLSVTGHTHTYLPLAGGTMAGALLFASGSAAAPGLAAASDIDVGIYYAATYLGVSIAGVGQVAVNDGTLYPITDNDIDLGTSTLSFKNLYAYAIYDEAGTARWDLSGNITCAGTITSTDHLPAVDNTSDLGSAAASWQDLFAYNIADEAGVTRLDLSGAWSPAGSIIPTVDSTPELGSATYSWGKTYTYAVYDEAGVLRLDLSGDWSPGGHIVPTSDAAFDLGTAAASFRILYAFALYDESGTIRFDLSGNLTPAGDIIPATDSDLDLGTAALSFDKVYANGIYDEAGITRLDLSGAWSPAGSIIPTADITPELGSATYTWGKVYMAAAYDETGALFADLSAQTEAAWAPNWNAVTADPTNYTKTAGFSSKTGRRVRAHAIWTCGASFTAGTGVYFIAMPESPSASYTVAAASPNGDTLGTVRFYDSSGTLYYTGHLTYRATTGTGNCSFVFDVQAGRWASTGNPAAPATGDVVVIDLDYLAAAA